LPLINYFLSVLAAEPARGVAVGYFSATEYKSPTGDAGGVGRRA
jgi:hypothetical protein